MSEKEFVPYQESLKLKELGFDEPCIAFYEEDTNKLVTFHTDSYQEVTGFICLDRQVNAPTFSQAFRFFREKYGIEPQVKSWEERSNIVWYYSVQLIGGEPSVFRSADCCVNSYEEAQLECLRRLIQIAKNG